MQRCVLGSKLDINSIFFPQEMLMPSRLFPYGLSRDHFGRNWEKYKEGLVISFKNLEDLDALYAQYVHEPQSSAAMGSSWVSDSFFLN